MWETIKNDPLLRTIVVLILGVLGFGFAFNIMFGGNYSGMEHGGTAGLSLDYTLSYILTLLVKILVITLVILAIAAVFKYLRKHFISDGSSGIVEKFKTDPILKIAAFVLLAVVIISLFYMFSGSTMAYGRGYQLPNNNYNMMSPSYGLSLNGVLILFVKVLLTISIIGLVIGLAVFFFQGGYRDNKDFIRFFQSEKAEEAVCLICGTSVKKEWTCCPKCGMDLDK